ncbi:zinc finger protein 512 isoform X2 [Erpetoichthys calabaricus]|uniref:zinc finger protein 512 isoform X2 n=1 Tax=Erpetoichthys calabaricus TaxID=27687 RepID=UPI0022340FFE|nr:zinc finger protein 512 isoform X2 [Erpetoichthys calabaricus]
MHSSDSSRNGHSQLGKMVNDPVTSWTRMKSKSKCRKTIQPVYQSGSEEEKWSLQILHKGRVSCPTCKAVFRKTVEGLKKHMANCKMDLFTCQHCGKQLKSLTGIKYHIMADHNELPNERDIDILDIQSVKEKLRKVLKRMGKLKCTKQSCTASFTSIMGYMYHIKKCGKKASELENLMMNCKYCGKAYKSKAGLEYHMKSEHGPTPESSEEDAEKNEMDSVEAWTASGRVKRRSAQLAIYHLQEIAIEELSREWPKRKVQQDLVPDDKKLKYARPGLPTFKQDMLEKWKNKIKVEGKVQCPNQGCISVYTSISGLKAHLCLCSKGNFEAGKYKCLLCKKEFISESGVKYHINSVHAQDWFVITSEAMKSLKTVTKRNQSAEYLKRTRKKKPSLRLRIKNRRLSQRPTAACFISLKSSEDKQTIKQKNCYDFHDSESESKSSSSSSSSDCETDEEDEN